MDFDVPIQTTVHVVISLVAIASGAVVAYGFLAAKRLDIWTVSFLVTTVLTSVTGFLFFPIERFTPALGIGAISLIVLAVAILGRYGYHLAGRRRKRPAARSNSSRTTGSAAASPGTASR